MTDTASYSTPGYEDNDLVPLLLGAMRLLDEFGAAAADAAPALSTTSRAESDALLAAALGLLSLKRTMGRWVGIASRDRGQGLENDDARAPIDLSLR
jgi:hypothetical protein